MLNLASAAKALKAISEDGDALRCVEHAPAEERRAVLKDIRKLAGPICMSFMMGEMEWPRKKQGVIMDAVMASRITLVASNAETKFVLTDPDEGDEAGGTASAALSRRAASDLSELKTTQGLLAARRNALAMLRDYGLEVREDEDLGRTRFELTMVGGAGTQVQGASGRGGTMDAPRPGLQVGPLAAVPVAGSLGEGGSMKTSSSSSSGSGSRGPEAAAPGRTIAAGESFSEARLTRVLRELTQTERAIGRVLEGLQITAREVEEESVKVATARQERERSCCA